MVEVTEEAKEELTKIENKIGKYICRLCKEVYVDAFGLAQHRYIVFLSLPKHKKKNIYLTVNNGILFVIASYFSAFFLNPFYQQKYIFCLSRCLGHSQH